MFNFDEKTNDAVQRVITSAYHANQRLRVVFGDVETGEDWLEKHCVIGTVGRSAGTIKKPLLINNSRSTGGCAILTNCILKIVDVKNKHVLYEALNYKKPIFVKCASTHNGYMYDVYNVKNGSNILHARFKTEKSADNYIEFMQCKRMTK